MASDLDNSWDNDDRPSKSQRKREAHAVLDVARRVVELSASQLERVPMDDHLRSLVEDAKRTTQRIARKRAIHYLAKRMREADLDPILAAIKAIEEPGIAERQRLHRLEGWRDRVLEDQDVLFRLRETHPQADFNDMRRLALRAIRERDQERPPAAARQLFKRLSELDRESELPTLDD